MIVSVFIRRLKEGKTFEEFIEEWEADEGFGVPARVINAPSVSDPRDIITLGFVAIDADALVTWMTQPHAAEAVRHDRIDTVIESTTLKCQYEVRTEHDFTAAPREIELGDGESLFHAFLAG